MTQHATVKQLADHAYWEISEWGLPVRIQQGWKRGDPIEYIRKDIPAFDLPAYSGRRYEALVPDTLDLQERAAFAVNAITGSTDELADHDIYFFIYFQHCPPMMQHDSDSTCLSKFTEALPLMRQISGSDQNLNVDRTWMEVALKQQGEDGLAYWSLKGRPWALHRAEVPKRALDGDYYIDPFYCGRLLSTMVLYALRDGGILWKETAIKLANGLIDFAVDKGPIAYFGPHHSWAERGSTVDPAQTEGTTSVFHCAQTILGMLNVYRQFDHEPALAMAGKLVQYMVEYSKVLDDEGRFNYTLRDSGDRNIASRQARHFHSHTGALHAALEYGMVTGESKWIEIARRGYEYGKVCGNDLLGYFPEFVDSERLEHSEACEVADMIALGLKLTEAGAGDYWDDVDRWARNMFAEGQLTQADWVYRLQTMGFDEKRDFDVRPSVIHETHQTTDRVAERNIGAWAGWPKANDWYVGQGMGIMHCCTGNATRALYYLWHRILTYDNGRLKVNLLLNRASKWADVDSHIPYTGQVDIRMKESADLSVRIPQWVEPEQAHCRIGDSERSISFTGRYAEVRRVDAGDVVTLTFPIEERNDVTYVEKEKYTLIRKGNDMVNIEPPGKYCPLYQRQHYRANTTRWRKIKRFVSDQVIDW